MSRTDVLDQPVEEHISVANDPYSLRLLKHYRSLMPLAQEAHKPIFHLKSADGALGAHLASVQSAYKDFEALARRIAERTGLHIPALVREPVL